MDKDLKTKTPDELRELAGSCGQKPFAGDYLFSFIHQKDARSIADVTPLSKAFRETLTRQGYFISRLSISQQHDDPDGTIKFVFELGEKSCIESVLLKDEGRQTLCLSTQAGCRMRCRICATGQLRFERDLTPAEIVDQVYCAAQAAGRIDNVVYMGMGEPLDNFANAMRSIELLHCESGRNIGIRHITVSTCGLPDGIRQLAVHPLLPRLAVSLHAPTDAARKKIMPSAAKHSLHDILAALKFYQQQTGKRFTIEYCMIAGLNDTAEQARLLVNLLKPFKVNVNLIELNPYPGCPFSASSPEQMRQFANILNHANIETVIRFRRGRSIKAACGQLGATRLPK
ncbi:MAG: 23S rRNA (adenine(2503)-C(2))-methyltransferase RlmN [Planctomycetaceae bacterium]|nr:23S rRNA (adenine(2503)-C(2))-methyltransferase RlmN [Planctomycetaceae bacterium]